MPAPSRKGLIIVHTGEGKGKTTAALGIAFRALGYDMKILMIQFLKGTWHYGELEAAKAFPNFEIHKFGEGFTWITQNRGVEKQKSREAWEFAKERIASGKYDIVILDEINYAISYGHIDPVEAAEFLKKKPPTLHVILTGRDAHEKIIEVADLVSEMREIKHPFKKGVSAQKGIEF